jgi:hypothetical protein
MNSVANKYGMDGVRQFHRVASTACARPTHRKWVFAGMLAAAAGVLVWRAVSGTTKRS